MTVRGNVRFYNSVEDKLQTSELIWDENLKKSIQKNSSVLPGL